MTRWENEEEGKREKVIERNRKGRKWQRRRQVKRSEGDGKKKGKVEKLRKRRQMNEEEKVGKIMKNKGNEQEHEK